LSERYQGSFGVVHNLRGTGAFQQFAKAGQSCSPSILKLRNPSAVSARQSRLRILACGRILIKSNNKRCAPHFSVSEALPEVQEFDNCEAMAVFGFGPD
jgi:hypothetical protein